jgi:hypothetical protein
LRLLGARPHEEGAAEEALFACLTALKGVGLVLACTLIANMR